MANSAVKNSLNFNLSKKLNMMTSSLRRISMTTDNPRTSITKNVTEDLIVNEDLKQELIKIIDFSQSIFLNHIVNSTTKCLTNNKYGLLCKINDPMIRKFLKNPNLTFLEFYQNFAEIEKNEVDLNNDKSLGKLSLSNKRSLNQRRSTFSYNKINTRRDSRMSGKSDTSFLTLKSAEDDNNKQIKSEKDSKIKKVKSNKYKKSKTMRTSVSFKKSKLSIDN